MLKRVGNAFHGLTVLLVAAVLCGTVLAACSSGNTQPTSQGTTVAQGQSKKVAGVNVAVSRGTLSVGMASFVDQAKKGELEGTYHVAVLPNSDQIVSGMKDGDLDIAVMTPSAASTLFNETKGEVSVISINALGGLGVVTGNRKVKEFADLDGRTVYMADEGSVSQYVVEHLLALADMGDTVKLDFKGDSVGVVAQLRAERTTVSVLAQPYATASFTENKLVRQVVDLVDVWDELSKDSSRFVGGVTVVRNDLLKRHPEMVAAFLLEQAESVRLINEDPTVVLDLVSSTGIMDAEMVTVESMKACHPVCIQGTEMRDALSGYLTMLYKANPSAIGGLLPTGDFYYGA